MVQPGFLRSLFDVSFESFVTTRVIRLLYVLTLALLALAYVAVAIALLTGGGDTTSLDANGDFVVEPGGANTALGLLWLFVLGPLLLFFYTLLYRVLFEFVVVVFRIHENTREQVELLRGRAAGGGTPDPMD